MPRTKKPVVKVEEKPVPNIWEMLQSISSNPFVSHFKIVRGNVFVCLTHYLDYEDSSLTRCELKNVTHWDYIDFPHDATESGVIVVNILHWSWNEYYVIESTLKQFADIKAEQEDRAMRKKNALSKLTDDEKKLLGL